MSYISALDVSPHDLLERERRHLLALRRGAFVIGNAFRVHGSPKRLSDTVVGRLIGMGLATSRRGAYGIVRVSLTDKGREFEKRLRPPRVRRR